MINTYVKSLSVNPSPDPLPFRKKKRGADEGLVSNEKPSSLTFIYRQ